MIEGFADFHFLRPLWLLALPVAPLLWWLARRARAGAGGWREAVAPQLLRVLLEERGQGRGLRPAVFAAAATLTILALAGPAWERLPEPVGERTDGLVVVLDVSMSMLAEDVAPSRMARARHKLADLLGQRQEGVTALVAYAGDAHVVTPLTDDTRTIANLVGALHPSMMPVQGSRPGAALELARTLYRNAGMEQGRVLLITDAVERARDVTEHATRSFPVSILGIGTEEGAPIPVRVPGHPTQLLRAADGLVVQVRLDAEHLADVAQASHGRYRDLAINGDDLADLQATPLPTTAESRQTEHEFDIWRDAGHWLLAPLAVLVLTGFRRGALAAVPVLVLAGAVMSSQPASADLWERPDQRAHRLLREGDAERAAGLFEDRRWRAVARYRSADYTGAIQDFAADPTPTGRFNLGNALARAGRLQEAVIAFDAVLAAAPGHEDAAHNKALVEETLRQQEASEGQPNASSERRTGEGMPSEASEARPDPSSTGNAGDAASDQPASGEDNPTAQQVADDSGNPEHRRSQEARAATEQWLRRIPDDPTGLLARKFQHETRSRLRSGDYRYRQTERVW